jgi:hypothetical protein
MKKKEVGKSGPTYTIDFLNFEVRDAFLTSLLGTYAQKREEEMVELSDKINESIEKSQMNRNRIHK